jgi:hypothetical protein
MNTDAAGACQFPEETVLLVRVKDRLEEVRQSGYLTIEGKARGEGFSGLLRQCAQELKLIEREAKQCGGGPKSRRDQITAAGSQTPAWVVSPTITELAFAAR